MCFLSSSIWVVCSMGCLWTACPGILWKVGCCVLQSHYFYHRSCFPWFPKWEMDLARPVYLETHHLLNSIIFIFFAFERCILWNEKIVSWYKLSPSDVSLVGREKPTITFLGRHHLLWLLSIAGIKVSWIFCLSTPFSECRSYSIPGEKWKD